MKEIHKRVDWIDATKGLCMLGIIYVHTPGRDEQIAKWILSFALPTFLFCSGRVQRNEETCSFIKKIIIKLIIPCITGLIFLYAFDCTFHYVTNDKIDLKKQLIHFLGGNTSVLWFVTTLINIKIIHFLLYKIVKKLEIVRKNEVLLFTSFGVAIMAVLFRIVGGGKAAGNELPWGWSKIPFLLVFYAFGFYCNMHQWDINVVRRFRSDLLVISFLLSFFASYTNANSSIVTNEYGNHALFYAFAGIGLLFISLMGKNLESSKLLLYIGKNSFCFLCFHPLTVKIPYFLAHFYHIEYSKLLYLVVIATTILMVFFFNFFVDFMRKRLHIIKSK